MQLEETATVFDFLAILCSLFEKKEERECAIRWGTATRKEIERVVQINVLDFHMQEVKMMLYKEVMINFFSDDLSTIESKSKQFVKKIVELMTDSDFETMNQLFESAKSMKYSGQGYLESLDGQKSEMSAVLNVGYIYALIDMMQLYQEKLRVENEIIKVKTKYRDKMLSILARRGTMFHKDLASAMGLSASGLNNVIKQMNGTSVKLINIEEVSKFKLYSLTAVSYRYIMKYNLERYSEQKRKVLKPTVSYEVLRESTRENREGEYPILIETNYHENAVKQNRPIEFCEILKKKEKPNAYQFENMKCSVG